MFQDLGLTVLTSLVLIMISVPPILFLFWYIHDIRQSQHSILRNFPLLGRIRYFLEMMGPELRQYMFDGDTEFDDPELRIEEFVILMDTNP